MKKILFISSFIVTVLGFSSCIHLLPIALDTADDNDPYYTVNQVKNVDYVDKFTATDLFTDDLVNTWGTEKDACREFVVVDSIKKGGASSLLMSWDKSKKGCDWIGVGFNWNNWQVVDMTNVIDTWAVRFWIRTKEGKMPNIPLTLSFLDDANKTTDYITVSEKFYKGPGIDETWKEVIIPLSYFRFVPKGLNLTAIKQLTMTFEGKASVYFDEFQFINLNKTTTDGSVAKTNTFTATDVFTESTTNSWGLEKDDCRDFKTVNDVKKSGNSSLYLSWDKSKKGCEIISAGFAWNNWQVVNFSQINDSWALHFWIRTKEGKLPTIPLSLNFIDNANGASKSIEISNAYYKGESIDESWKEVTIPISEFQFKQNGLNLFEISQLIMSFEGTASVYMDDIQFVKLPAKTSK